eukprot:gene544-368_t
MTSHADTLQILQTYFLSSDEGVDPRHFHRYRFSNGEVRDLRNLPVPKDLMYK